MAGTPTTPEEFRRACHGIVPVEFRNWVDATPEAYLGMYGGPSAHARNILRAWCSDLYIGAFRYSLSTHEQAALLLRLEGVGS